MYLPIMLIILYMIPVMLISPYIMIDCYHASETIALVMVEPPIKDDNSTLVILPVMWSDKPDSREIITVHQLFKYMLHWPCWIKCNTIDVLTMDDRVLLGRRDTCTHYGPSEHSIHCTLRCWRVEINRS